MKYVHYDKESMQIQGFYDEEAHREIPTPCFKISDKEWQKALDEGANFVNLKDNSLFCKVSKTDKKMKQKAEIVSSIAQIEEKIQKALFLGEEENLSSLRSEYKKMLSELEKL
ncbi:hypothetical protein [Campylobacter sp. RM16188]|uniref:hypothetical protein n=1 Tax=Campylobacter sp. RM16188 TaxID=1705725 RepID=UPI0015543498|nr:hypothetical protein [Campylobacter sp. RM16188]